MKKQILFVINTLGQAGAEVAMLELIKKLNIQEVDIDLLVLTGQGELIDLVPRYVNVLNTDYCHASVLSEEGRKNLKRTVIKSAFRRGNIFRLMPYMIRNLFHMLRNNRVQSDKLLWRLVSDGAPVFKKEYDLAIAYLEGGSTYYVGDHVRAKKKAAFVHIDYSKAGYTRKLDKNCYLLFDRIFTVSAEVKAKFLEGYPECTDKVKIFENLIDCEGIVKKSKLNGGFNDDYKGVRLLTVGRLTHQKAYDIAIQALKIVKENGYAVRWYVLGEGDKRAELEKLISENELENDFILAGAVSNPYPYYAQTDIYIHASRYEGKSIAIREAQTLGCPIIASDCSGNREQIQNGIDGILCKLTAQDIAKGIMLLIDDKSLREKYSIESRKKNIVDESYHIEMISELLSIN